MKANKSLKTLLPNSCNPMRFCSQVLRLSLLGAPEVSAGFWWISEGKSSHRELIHPPVCNQGGCKGKVAANFDHYQHTLNHENIFSLLNFYLKKLATGKSTCYSLAHYIQLHADTYSAVYFFSVNRETSMRERNSCLVLQ